jgi:hypothetical protein
MVSQQVFTLPVTSSSLVRPTIVRHIHCAHRFCRNQALADVHGGKVGMLKHKRIRSVPNYGRLVLGIGVIGNTRDFDSLIPGSSPGSSANKTGLD